MGVAAKLILVVLVAGLSVLSAPASGHDRATPTEVYTTTLTISTYPFAGYLHTRTSDLYNMTYKWLNWDGYLASNPTPFPKDYTAVILENTWLRLTILPELGGRLYGITVKATGDELLYQNPVIKPTHWGPPEQGWWLAAGGIEWCLPVEEHGYEWGVPWDYEVTQDASGATVTVSDTQSNDRIRARVAIHLPADEATVHITPRLENPTGQAVSFKFWTNSMQAPGWPNTVSANLRFEFPIDQVTVHSRDPDDNFLPGPGEQMDWPVHGGVDYSRLGNWSGWLGFFARPQAQDDWAGIYSETVQSGLARVFPHETAVGLKGFGFGWSDPIDPGNWTDDGSKYVELHSGPSPTFWDSLTLAAGGALEWTEVWLPLRDLPGLSLATAGVALGVKASGQDLHLGFLVASSASGLEARLWRTQDCTLLWSQDGLSLSAGEAYAQVLAGVGLAPDQVALAALKDGELLATTEIPQCPPLVSQVDPLQPYQTSLQFSVGWSGVDPAQKVAVYDIEVRDGDATAAWTPWLTGATTESTWFTGQDGHTYTFRSRVRGVFGGQEAWPSGEWDDTFTTVLLEPAPVLVTSEKRADPVRAYPGEVVEFEIYLENTGNQGASLDVTDSIPGCMELTSDPTSSIPPDPLVIGDTIVWNGNLDAGHDGLIGFQARVTCRPEGGQISNVATIDDGLHPPLLRAVTIDTRLAVYLPLVLRR